VRSAQVTMPPLACGLADHGLVDFLFMRRRRDLR